MIQSTLSRPLFTYEEAELLLEAVKWQRVMAEEERPDRYLEEYVLFCHYLEDKLRVYLQNMG